MKIIRPVDITNALLVSSNITASTLNEYNKATTYSATDTVKVSYEDGTLPVAYVTSTAFGAATRAIPTTHNGFVYVSDGGTTGGTEPTWPTVVGETVTDNDITWTCQAMLAPINEYVCVLEATDKYPPDDDGTYWTDSGASNRWKWADQFIGTTTKADGTESTDAGKIVMVFQADKCDSIGLFGLVGQTYQIDRYDSTDTLIDTTGEIELQNAAIYGDAWSYLYEDFIDTHDLIVDFGINHVQTIKLTITHNTTAGYYPEIGFPIVGRSIEIGSTRYDAQTGITSYAKKETDPTFGVTYLAPGPFSKWMDIDVIIETYRFSIIQAILASVEGRPTVFWGNNPQSDCEAINILGWCHDFTLTLKGPKISECKLEIKGLI